MKRSKLKTNVVFNKFIFVCVFFLFAIIFVRTIQISLAQNIDGMNIKEFSANLKTETETIISNRGYIYDKNKNVLAQNVSSYTVVAYLSSKRESDYVKDKENTAKKLSPLLNMEEEDILYLLNKDLYQVELGPGGRNLSQNQKDEVEALELEGIGFIKSVKRYYPNGDYASYILGYAKKDDDNKIIGEMGVEKYFDEDLTGEEGYSKYVADRLGIKIPNTYEEYKPAVDGSDVYLTIDTNIQLFTEQALKGIDEKSNPDWGVIMVADAKTGAILGASSIPSFDPNIRNVTNYLNPMTSVDYEPGSTMKIFTYMAALEKGTYNGEDTYESGEIVIEEDTVKDWNIDGWGEITFDQGFALSSNVAVSTLIERDIIKRDELKEYFLKLGFNSITGINLPNESSGNLDFKYPIETANASFGQGINTTAIQNIRALTSIANKGIMLSPYLVEKVVTADGQVLFSNSKKEIGRVASEKTVSKIIDLMDVVVNGSPSQTTGYRYNSGEYNLIGKTGTAQIFDTLNKEYLSGYNDYVKSFAGMFPKEEPEVIIYASIKRGTSISVTLPAAITELTESIGKYLNINQDQTNNIENIQYELPSYINKYKEISISDLKQNGITPTVLGNGNKIINQSPSPESCVTYLDKVFLLTNDATILMPDLTGFSMKDVITFANLVGIKANFEGTGFVKSQSLKAGETITLEDVNFVLEKRIE